MKLDRLISILVILLRKERVQAKELAEKFGVSVRTILRDVEAINLAGIPIVTHQGANGGIGIAEGYRLDRSVLNENEMAAIITTLKGVSRTMPDSGHEILVEKIKNTLPSPQLQTLNSKVNQLIIDLSPWGGNHFLKEMIAKIRKAIENLNELEFEYMNAAGRRTSRRVEPYSLILKGQKWYLYAWCHYRQDFRLFKLSRIKELLIVDTSYSPREASLDQLPWEQEWQKPENMISLELAFEKEMEGIIDESWFGGEITRGQDGRLIVKTLLPENDWLYGFLLSFGAGVEVINPPHIRKILAQIAQEISKKHSGGT